MDTSKPILANLQVLNVEDVIDTFSGRSTDFYKGPYEIIGDLEKIVAYQFDADPRVFIPYKDDGDAIFEHVETKNVNDIVTHIYEYSATIS